MGDPTVVQKHRDRAISVMVRPIYTVAIIRWFRTKEGTIPSVLLTIMILFYH